MRSIFRNIGFLLYLFGITGALLAGSFMVLAMDFASGQKFFSRHLLTEIAVSAGAEETTDILYPEAQGDFMQEIELTMDPKDLQDAGRDLLKTPFEFAYEFNTKGGRKIYGGSRGALLVLRSQIRRVEGKSDSRIRVIGREMTYRSRDMGPVMLKVSLTAPANVFIDHPIVRLYDKVDARKFDAILPAALILDVCAPFVALIGLILFIRGVLKKNA